MLSNKGSSNVRARSFLRSSDRRGPDRSRDIYLIRDGGRQSPTRECSHHIVIVATRRCTRIEGRQTRDDLCEGGTGEAEGAEGEARLEFDEGVESRLERDKGECVEVGDEVVEGMQVPRDA